MQEKGKKDKMSKRSPCPSDDSAAVILQLTFIIFFTNVE